LAAAIVTTTDPTVQHMLTSRDTHTVSVDEKVRNALALRRETKTIRLRPILAARLATAVRMGAEAHPETFTRVNPRHRPKQGRSPEYIQSLALDPFFRLQRLDAAPPREAADIFRHAYVTEGLRLVNDDCEAKRHTVRIMFSM
jgi:hypothetical protein